MRSVSGGSSTQGQKYSYRWSGRGDEVKGCGLCGSKKMAATVSGLIQIIREAGCEEKLAELLQCDS
jgi:hypothetical protein